MARKDMKNGTLKIQDAAAGNSITVKFGEGNLTWSEKRNIEITPDRGVLSTGEVREGDEVPCEVKFEGVFEYYTASSGGTETPRDAITGQGEASAWTSVADDCEPYAVDLLYEDNITCGTIQDETIQFNTFFWEQIDFDLKAGTFSCSGRCKEVSPTATRTTLS